MKDTFAVRLILILIAATVLFVVIHQYNANTKLANDGIHKSNGGVNKVNPKQTERFVQPIDSAVSMQQMQPMQQMQQMHPMQQMQKQHIMSEESEMQDKKITHNQINTVMPNETEANEMYRIVNDDTFSTDELANQYPRDRITSIEELLPKDAANSKFAQVNPAGQGDVKDQNFLTAGFHIGINSVGNNLRNPNLSIRSEPPNPRIEGLSPWMISTIEPDVNRRNFEIGET